MTKRILQFMAIFCFTLLITNNLAAEDSNSDLKRYRIAFKAGTPSLTGISLEYVIPALGNRLSANFDFSYYPLTIDLQSHFNEGIEIQGQELTEEIEMDDAEFNTMYWGLGVNYYLTENSGSGYYLGVGYSSLSFDFMQEGIPFSVDLHGYDKPIGEVDISRDVSFFQLKAGWKGVWSYFTFGTEIGWGFNSGLDDIETPVQYPDIEGLEEQLPPEAREPVEIPDAVNIGLSLILNFSIGIAF